MSFNVGDTVVAAHDIFQDASGDWPRIKMADKGDALIVRSTARHGFVAYVSHPNITTGSFGVYGDEIRKATK